MDPESAVEQLETANDNIARILGDFRRNLEEQGFSRVEAMEIILEYAIALFEKLRSTT